MVALLTSVRNSPCFGGLRRTKTCHRQLFARPSVFLRYFLHAAKSTNPFPLRERSRFSKPRFSSPKQQLPTNKIKSFAALRPFLRPWRPFSVAAATNLCASRYYRRPCRLCNFPMESLSLPGRHTPWAFVCFSFKRKADGRQSRNTSDGYFRVARLGTLDRIRIKHRPMAATI